MSLKWRFDTGNWIPSSPAIGSDGTVYFGSLDGFIYARRIEDGSEKWSFKTGGRVECSPAISTDGSVFCGSWDSYFYAFNTNNGSVKWRYKFDNATDSPPVIGKDGTVYVGGWDGHLYALDGATGQLKWRYQTALGTPTRFTNQIWSAPALGDDGTVFVGNLGGWLHAVSPDGSLKWSYEVGDWLTSSPAVGKDGTVFVGRAAPEPMHWYKMTGKFSFSKQKSDNGYIYAINSDGSLKWRYKTGDSVWSSPVLDSNGDVFVGSDDGFLYSLSGEDGSMKWRSKVGNSWLFTFPAIGPDGTIYVGSDDGALHKVGLTTDYAKSEFHVARAALSGNSSDHDAARKRLQNLCGLKSKGHQGRIPEGALGLSYAACYVAKYAPQKVSLAGSAAPSHWSSLQLVLAASSAGGILGSALTLVILRKGRAPSDQYSLLA